MEYHRTTPPVADVAAFLDITDSSVVTEATDNMKTHMDPISRATCDTEG